MISDGGVCFWYWFSDWYDICSCFIGGVWLMSERFAYIPFDGFEDNGEYITPNQVVELLNELHEENEFLKSNYKELVQFVKSKGYTLKDFISFIGQFQSVGVNKEDWE